MVKEIKQDIFLAETDAIVHQANCQCTMGSGIAKYIKERYPEAYAADCKTIKGDKEKLGRASVARVVTPSTNTRLKYIFNLYSQFNYGLEERHTNYEAMATGLSAIYDFIMRHNMSGSSQKITVLAAPFKMGSDRGGGDWRIVRAIMESVFADETNITLLICDNTSLGEIPANKNSK